MANAQVRMDFRQLFFIFLSLPAVDWKPAKNKTLYI